MRESVTPRTCIKGGWCGTPNADGIYVFDVMRVVGGCVVEHWGVPKRLGVLGQVGAITRPSGIAMEP